jgi:hypothetical protein
MRNSIFRRLVAYSTETMLPRSAVYPKDFPPFSKHFDYGQHRFDEEEICEPIFRGLVAYSVEKDTTFHRLVNMSTMGTIVKSNKL